ARRARSVAPQDHCAAEWSGVAHRRMPVVSGRRTSQAAEVKDVEPMLETVAWEAAEVDVHDDARVCESLADDHVSVGWRGQSKRPSIHQNCCAYDDVNIRTCGMP